MRTLIEPQGQKVDSPEEIAEVKGWISEAEMRELAIKFGKNGYGSDLGS